MCGLRVVRKGASEKVTFERRLHLCERNPGSLGLRLRLCELGGRREGSSFRGPPWSLLQVPGPRRQSWPGGGRGRQARPGGDLAPTPVLEPWPRPRVSGSSHQPVGVPSAGARPLPHAPHSSPPLMRFFPFFPRRPLTWTDCPLVPSCFLLRCSRHSGALVTSAAPAVDGVSLSVGHHPKQTSLAGARHCGGAHGGSRGPRREPSLCCGRRLVCFVNN